MAWSMFSLIKRALPSPSKNCAPLGCADLKPTSVVQLHDWLQGFPQGESGWPRVSVVVCSYNGGATLRECLDSLMRLDYPDYEVILVDDGSTDDTPQIAAEFPQVVCLRQENRGLSVARNVGATHADGPRTSPSCTKRCRCCE